MANSDAERAMALIRKALSTTSVEEARTCAMTAVRHVIEKHLTVVDPKDLPPPPPPKKPKAETYSQYGTRGTYRRPPRAPSRISFMTECLYCKISLLPGAEVFWSPAFSTAICARCFEDHFLHQDP